MLGLPVSTEIRKVITKKKVFEHFGAAMSAERRRSFDADIARIVLVNEVSPASVNIAAGQEVQAFFVVQITLRKPDYDRQNIVFIAKMFGQKLLLVIEYEQMRQLALWQTRLIIRNEGFAIRDYELPAIELNGMDLDRVWENIVAGIAGVAVAPDRTLDEQLALQQKREKLQKEIARLEKLAWIEKQPKRKMELARQKKKLEEEYNGLKLGS